MRAGLQARQVQLQQSQPIFQEREDLQQQLQEANLWPQLCLCIPCSKVLCTAKPCRNCGRKLYIFCIFWRKVRASVTQFRQVEAAMQMQLQEASAFVVSKKLMGWVCTPSKAFAKFHCVPNAFVLESCTGTLVRRWITVTGSIYGYPHKPCRRPRHMPSSWKKRNAEAKNKSTS